MNETMHKANFAVRTAGDLEIVMTRDFEAARELVFDAFTKPELVRRWLLGPDGWSMPVCEIDLRPGGAYRYVWRKDGSNQEMALGGVFREIVRPERIVHSERFEQPWYPGDAVVTTAFDQHAGTTTVTMTIRYDSRKTRDMALQSGMDTGVARSYERLGEILRSMPPDHAR